MGRRAWAAVGASALIGGACVAGADAAPTAGAPADSALVLSPADVPGATVTSHKRIKNLAFTEYEQTLRFTKPYGASKYMVYDSVSLLQANTDLGKRVYAAFVKLYTSPKGRATLVKVFSLTGQGVTLGKARTHPVALGDAGIEVTFAARHKSDAVNVSLVLFRIDRLVEVGAALGNGAAGKPADAVALGKLVETRARAALSPARLTAPTVAGTPTQGQTLTARAGTWTNTPTTYRYQWQHCDAAGANCTDLAGATAATYVVAATDVGARLRVNVTATNGVASAAAPSPVTVAVT